MPKNEDELVAIFPTPILISKYPFQFDKELEYINSIQYNERNTDAMGKHSRQSKDSFILDNIELIQIKNFIEEKVNEFARKILGSDKQFIITQSWANKSSNEEFHHEHTHPNSILSGVWYPYVNENHPPLLLHRRDKSNISLRVDVPTIFNQPTMSVSLKSGELIIFPSTLVHSVLPNQSNKERISLSFNTWVKGSIGEANHLTYLPIEKCI
jgi:uncharacterized protein (TIGR02466 family)